MIDDCNAGSWLGRETVPHLHTPFLEGQTIQLKVALYVKLLYLSETTSTTKWSATSQWCSSSHSTFLSEGPDRVGEQSVVATVSSDKRQFEHQRNPIVKTNQKGRNCHTPISQLVDLSRLRWVGAYVGNYVWCLICPMHAKGPLVI